MAKLQRDPSKEPMPIDAEEPVKKLKFVPLSETHIELLHRWLNEPHVMEWWGKSGCSLTEVRKKYLPRISREIADWCFICFDGNEPIGYIQTYRLIDFPDYVEQLGIKVDESVAALDLFIGDARNLNKGYGTAMVKQFLKEIIFGEKMNANTCTVGPDERNEISIKAYRRAGFRHWTTAEVKGSGIEYLMKIGRADLTP